MGVHYQLKPLSEQVIVITGASSGIGLATARMAAKKGARLALASRNLEALNRICDELAAQGCEAIPVETDVKSRADAAKLADAAIARFGRMDTWVNNAGVGMFASLRDLDIESHREIFEVLYWGVVHGSMEALEHMRQRGGALINVGSVLSDVPIPLQAPYVAAKHAVRGFTDTLRIELAHDHVPVSVTLIKPSAIATPFSDHARTLSEDTPVVPPPRYAPELVADAILHAAATPTRELYVGGVAPVMALLHSLAPGLYDQVALNMGYKSQFIDEPVDRSDPMRDNLFEPRRDGFVTSPTLDTKGIPFSIYTEIAKRPQLALAGAAALVAGVALAAVQQRRRNGENGQWRNGRDDEEGYGRRVRERLGEGGADRSRYASARGWEERIDPGR